MQFSGRFKMVSRPKILLVIVCALAGFLLVSSTYSVSGTGATSEVVRMVPEGFTELAEKNSPAVVNIRTEKTNKMQGSMNPYFEKGPWGKDDHFRDFFEKFFGGQPQREFKQLSLGSGFIIDEQGYIVTNNHVVEGADKIKVILKDHKEFDAEVVGRDPNTDLALIRVNPDNHLPKVELGDSDILKVGEWVIAIGNPFGLDHTVTSGIISAKGRVIGSGPYDDFLQTDASINPGNSGGPLINMKGKVVGINTAIIAGGQGIGFAVPINLAKGIIEQLKSRGEVSRGWLGVSIQPLDENIGDYYGLKDLGGVLVTQVFPEDPAAKAGIEAKDIIVKVNGRTVENPRELSRLIAEAGVGEIVEIVVLREGKEKTYNVKLAKRKDTNLASGEGKHQQSDELGIRVSSLTPERARQFGMKDTEGVVVVGVKPGSKAEKAGVKVGDLIKEINHHEVDTVHDYEKEINNLKSDEPVYMYIFRMNRGFMVIKMTK
jgi:serine protease Do